MKSRENLIHAINTRVDNNRDTQVNIRLTKAEHKFIKDIASETHTSVSEVIRTMIKEYIK